MEALKRVTYYILCDNDSLQEEVLKQVVFEKSRPQFLKSCKSAPEMIHIVSHVTDEKWKNAGYAHLTTFWHARQNGYPCFWNIDADDTCICLSPERVCEIFHEVEQYAGVNQIDIMSLDMWYSRTGRYHWSFGITYTNSTWDWFHIMKQYCEDEGLKSGQEVKNVDGYFSSLKEKTDLKAGTFYVENMKFIHYADDFFKRPFASGFFHWKDGKLILPILIHCFGMEKEGLKPIVYDVVKIDIGVKDREGTDFLMNYALPHERERVH
ncbi:MAG: hypothetical protein HFG14_04570 [Lachnospiraceae bacterium]|jgi:hypothetical protein|nr:hypothetical protein [Lachnospiraceae bacterium]